MLRKSLTGPVEKAQTVEQCHKRDQLSVESPQHRPILVRSIQFITLRGIYRGAARAGQVAAIVFLMIGLSF
jgi:hypothetical protein